MTDNVWSELKEEHIESKYLPSKKTSEMERRFQESVRKTSWNHWQTYPKIIDGQQDIRLRQFTEVGLETVLKKKSRKSIGLDEIPAELWTTRKYDDILLRLSQRSL